MGVDLPLGSRGSPHPGEKRGVPSPGEGKALAHSLQGLKHTRSRTPHHTAHSSALVFLPHSPGFK